MSKKITVEGAAPTTVQRFEWNWVCAGILANIAVIVVPSFGWEFRPISTWLTLVLFPYGILCSDWAPFYNHPTLGFLDVPSRYFFVLAPFPIYGIVLAFAQRRGRLRLSCYSLLILHTSLAYAAAKVFYRNY